MNGRKNEGGEAFVISLLPEEGPADVTQQVMSVCEK